MGKGDTMGPESLMPPQENIGNDINPLGSRKNRFSYSRARSLPLPGGVATPKDNKVLKIAGYGLGGTALLTLGGVGVAKITGVFEQGKSAVHQEVPPGFADHLKGNGSLDISDIEFSPVIDPQNPERVNIVLPGEPAPGQKLEIRQGPDTMGGGVRTIKRTDPITNEEKVEKVIVDSRLRINGLRNLTSPVQCEAQVKCTIAAGSTKMDKNGVVSPGGFHIKTEDAEGNSTIFMIRTASLKLTKELPPMESISLGNGESYGKAHYVPLGTKEEIGTFVDPSKKDSFTNAQIDIQAFSTVTGKDGAKHSGPADITIKQ